LERKIIKYQTPDFRRTFRIRRSQFSSLLPLVKELRIPTPAVIPTNPIFFDAFLTRQT
jgi:hypothetical protein